MNELCVQAVEHCTAVMSYSCVLQHGRITKQQQPQKQVTEVCVCVCVCVREKYFIYIKFKNMPDPSACH
uniref:Macaca fascicularis brain cDNA, clone: QflA-17089 n=1 Tax=Macaca fascicularis TaxID=9541 RepID=I7GI48_MACFA|nr:unnamed protein product [Macaca fascicularis]